MDNLVRNPFPLLKRIVELTYQILLKIKRKVFYKQNIYLNNISKDLHLQDVEIDNRFKVIKVNKAYERQLRAYANTYRSNVHYKKNVAYRLEREDRFVGYAVLDIVNDEIAYLSWIDLKKIELTDAKYNKSLNTEQAYFFDDHCVSKYRRMGLHKRIFHERINYCVNNNINEIFIAIMNDNKIAINNLSKFNFREIKSIGVSPIINR